MRVLIVEAEPLMAEVIRDGLRVEAIAADTARDGHAALDLLRHGGSSHAGLARWTRVDAPSASELDS